MIPIHELLNRIRWDSEYARADFVIGYYDRVTRSVIRVPIQQLQFDPQDHFDFYLVDQQGEPHTIPLHRIREVFRNGELIWSRKVE